HSMYPLGNAPATTEIYTLSLHDALPICCEIALWVAYPGRRGHRREQGHIGKVGQRTARVARKVAGVGRLQPHVGAPGPAGMMRRDRKSTRLNSSHVKISYAVFCLKKKKI